MLPPADPGDRTRCRDVEMPGLEEAPMGSKPASIRTRNSANPKRRKRTIAQPSSRCRRANAAAERSSPPEPIAQPAAPIAGEMITLRMEVFYQGDDSTPPTTVDVDQR